MQIPRTMSHSKMSVPRSDFAGASTVASNDDDFADAATDAGHSRAAGNRHLSHGDQDDDDDDFEDVSSREEPSVNKDAFNITAQSAKLQLDTISAVNAAMLAEASKNPNTVVSDAKVTQALTTYDAAVRSLSGLVGDLMRISKDRDAYWQYRLDREIDMRRMWEESMAKVAKEQEILEERVDQAEMKRKLAKRALREVMNESPASGGQRLEKDGDATKVDGTETIEAAVGTDDDIEIPPRSPNRTLTKKRTAMDQIALSDSESEDEDEFFDAVDAGEVELSQLPPSDVVPTPQEEEKQQLVVSSGVDISSAFKGYENGIRTRLKMDADDRPKISLWVSFPKSRVGLFELLTFCAGYPQVHDWQRHDKDDSARVLQRANFAFVPCW